MLLELPDDLQMRIARALNVVSSAAVLRFACACHELKVRLVSVLQDVSARRLRWEKNLSCKMKIGADGRSVSCTSRDAVNGWIAGAILPTFGRFSFSVHVNHTTNVWGGSLIIGVCNVENNHSWGLSLNKGMLIRELKQDGLVTNAVWLNEPGIPDQHIPPPPGFPDGANTQLMFDSSGAPFRNRSWLMPPDQPEADRQRVNHGGGALIEIIVDPTNGTLQFRVTSPHFPSSGQLLAPVLRGFPGGVALRPWARAMSHGDSITISPVYSVIQDT